jgi:hypothetical protein
MRCRVHKALVYLGLVEDAAVDAELRTAPLSVWRVTAVAVALCLGFGLALGVLSLVGVGITWRTPFTLAVVFGVASFAAGIAGHLRARF